MKPRIDSTGVTRVQKKRSIRKNPTKIIIYCAPRTGATEKKGSRFVGRSKRHGMRNGEAGTKVTRGGGKVGA